MSVPNGYAEGNIPLSVTGIAIVKVGDTDESIRAAAQRFGSQQDQIEQFCREVLTGTLRSVIGGMTALAINNDRATLAAKVAEMAENDLSGQGLVVDTLQIQDGQDTDGSTYLKDMGRPEQARVRQMADIAEAHAKQASEQAVAAADQIVAEAQQTLALKRARIKAATDKAAGEAANAGPLESAAQNQRPVKAPQLVAEQQAILTEKELNTTIRKQADANRYKTETDAAASKARTIAEAEAAKASCIAAAEARQAEGVAEAAAIQAIGLANAAATTAQADALAKYGQAAMSKMVVDQLPAIASAIASPMAGIANMTVISTDGATILEEFVDGARGKLREGFIGGAITVNGPEPLRVSTSPAAMSAAASVVEAPAAGADSRFQAFPLQEVARSPLALAADLAECDGVQGEGRGDSPPGRGSGVLQRPTRRPVAEPRARLSRSPEPKRDQASCVLEVSISGEQGEVVRDCQLSEQRVYRAELDARLPTCVRKARSAHVVVAARFDEFHGGDVREDSFLGAGRNEATKQLEKNHPRNRYPLSADQC